jgi:hypothetical protein
MRQVRNQPQAFARHRHFTGVVLVRATHELSDEESRQEKDEIISDINAGKQRRLADKRQVGRCVV